MLDDEKLKERSWLANQLKGMNISKFARDNRIPGGVSMIYQHLKGTRAISLDAGFAYAKAFNCELSDLSPRLADKARRVFVTSSNSNVQLGSLELQLLTEFSLLDESKKHRVLNFITGSLTDDTLFVQPY